MLIKSGMKFKSTTNLGEIAPRLAFIDNSKGIAIIFVVIGHVVYQINIIHAPVIAQWNFGFKPISKF